MDVIAGRYQVHPISRSALVATLPSPICFLGKEISPRGMNEANAGHGVPPPGIPCDHRADRRAILRYNHDTRACLPRRRKSDWRFGRIATRVRAAGISREVSRSNPLCAEGVSRPARLVANGRAVALPRLALRQGACPRYRDALGRRPKDSAADRSTSRQLLPVEVTSSTLL